MFDRPGGGPLLAADHFDVEYTARLRLIEIVNDQPAPQRALARDLPDPGCVSEDRRSVDLGLRSDRCCRRQQQDQRDRAMRYARHLTQTNAFSPREPHRNTTLASPRAGP